MENKINIAELLKDCPKGMELYSPIFGKVYLYGVRSHLAVIVNIGDEYSEDQEEFLYDGRYGINGNCMLFPSKDKDSWEGFVPPCKFKDGDIVSFSISPECTWIGIFKQYEENGKTFETYCSINAIGEFNGLCLKRHSLEGTHLATEEDKQELFDAIKANGCKWNAEKKCLEKLAPQYPKTYKECCDILGIATMDNDAQGYKGDLIICFQELIICRDAYWKLYSDEMMSDYPWKLDYRIDSTKFCIRNVNCKFEMTETVDYNTILAFPSKEMRDAFYENFKQSIELCKELL